MCKGPVKVLVTRRGFARGPELDQRNSTFVRFFFAALSSGVWGPAWPPGYRVGNFGTTLAELARPKKKR